MYEQGAVAQVDVVVVADGAFRLGPTPVQKEADIARFVVAEL
jgi:hypothetical protein